MTFTLRQLEAQFEKVVAIHSTEIETEEGNCKGLYVWRDDDGSKTVWGPTPIRYAFHDVETLAEADMLMFLCPACFAANNGAVGTHSVMVTFAGRNVPDEAGSRGNDGAPTRWTASGTNLDDLVCTPSILLTGGCAWHGFIGSSGIPPGHAG